MYNYINTCTCRRRRRGYGIDPGYGYVPGYGILPIAVILALLAVTARNRRGDTNIVNVNTDDL